MALASTLHLTPETMAEVWEAYSLNKQNLTELTMHQFEAYRNELIKVSQVTPATIAAAATEGTIATSSSAKGAAVVNAHNNNSNKRDANNNSNMVTPPTAKRHHSGSDGDVAAADVGNQKTSSMLSSVDQVAIPGGAGSPVAATAAAMNKATTIPLPKYEERTKVGQVVVAYPSNRPADAKGDDRNTKAGPRCSVVFHSCSGAAAGSVDVVVGKYNITQPYRHMFTTMEDRARALEELLVERKEAIVTYHGLSTESKNHKNDDGDGNDTSGDALQGIFAPLEEVNVARQGKITCVGRVCNEVRWAGKSD